MKLAGLICLLLTFLLYGIYTQNQIDELQGTLAEKAHLVPTSIQYDGGSFVEIKNPRRIKTQGGSPAKMANARVRLVDPVAAHNLDEVLSADLLPVRPSPAPVPRSIGEFRAVSDMSPRPEALAEPRNIGEIIPIKGR